MSTRQLVLFDIDGTLMRGAGPQHKEALIEAAAAVMGVRCSLDNVDTSGRLDRDLLSLMLANAGVAKHKVVPQLTRIMQAAQHHYSLNCKLDLSSKLCPGVREVLEQMRRRNIAMGLVTGNLSAIAWRKLELAGIAGYFTFGGFAEQGLTRARLAQTAVWKAKREQIVPRNCQVTLIGDHANDVAAAKANGFRAVAVATGVMKAQELLPFHPDLLLETLEHATPEIICGVVG